MEIASGLVVGDGTFCGRALPTVHACKHLCHQQAVGYRGSLAQSDPEYLVAERGDQLYLNMVDMRRLLHEYTGPIVEATLDFLERHHAKGPTLVHCNQGKSRAPSLALVYLAKRAGVLPDVSYLAAREGFARLYPRYEPGTGVAAYLEAHWKEIA